MPTNTSAAVADLVIALLQLCDSSLLLLQQALRARAAPGCRRACCTACRPHAACCAAAEHPPMTKSVCLRGHCVALDIALGLLCVFTTGASCTWISRHSPPRWRRCLDTASAAHASSSQSPMVLLDDKGRAKTADAGLTVAMQDKDHKSHRNLVCAPVPRCPHAADYSECKSSACMQQHLSSHSLSCTCAQGAGASAMCRSLQPPSAHAPWPAEDRHCTHLHTCGWSGSTPQVVHAEH